MNIDEVLDTLNEKDRLMYLSAKQVKESAFWKYLNSEILAYGEDANQRMLTKLMEGKEKEAVIAGAQIQAIDWVMKTIDSVIEGVESLALNQEQED